MTDDSKPQFDSYAGDYDAALNQGLSVSGEDKNYFARGRVLWLAKCLRGLGFRPAKVLDFGCGTGSAAPFFFEAWPELSELRGTDLSASSVEVARREHGGLKATFQPLGDYRPDGSMDLVFCNGVFHHIPLEQRAGAIKTIVDSLRPGGLFALFENNPLNPGTRYVMSKIPFDRDAITLTAWQSRRLVRRGGMKVLRTDYLFIFPRLLRWLRPAERLAIKLPLGTQYMVLARKPA